MDAHVAIATASLPGGQASRTCRASGGAGENFVGGGRGEQFRLEGAGDELEKVGHMRALRAKAPRRRAVRARVGVLEDILGPAGG